MDKKAKLAPVRTDPLPPTEGQGEPTKESSKRRRNQLSCAECRRLKLRCDRVFPCESCRKRGCAAICPEGALATKGTRFVLANTETYHAKIAEMSERIRLLENALAGLNTDAPHPLLREDLLRVKVPVELSTQTELSQKALPPPPPPKPRTSRTRDDAVATLLNAYGTLKLGPDGRSKFFGQTAGGEYFLKDDDSPEDAQLESSHLLPVELQRVSQVFPRSSGSRDAALVQSILDHLPSIDVAHELVDIYYAHMAWLYEPCPRPQFTESFEHVIEHLRDPEGVSLHRLALVFAIMAHGALMDLREKPYSPYSVQLHQLARASLSASNFIQEPSLYAVQTLFLLGLFWMMFNKKEAANAGWLIQGLNCKLAQTLGLHRDLDYWDSPDTLVQGDARRKVFWELITLDGWISLGLGRPSAIELAEVHCKMPAETLRAMNSSNAQLHHWHTWKHGLAIHIFRVLQKALCAKSPRYPEILELDRNIQAYKMPPDVVMLLNGVTPPEPGPGESPGLIMQRYVFIQGHSTLLLLLHRGFFAQALDEETDPMQSKFAPSVLATYTHAWRIILSLQSLYAQQPALTCRFGLFWSNAFSSSIIMCLLVTRATRSSYATSALDALDLVVHLFSSAAPDCAPAAQALPIVTRLRDKAHTAYSPYRHGHPASLIARDPPSDNEDEELKTLGGKKTIAQLFVPIQPSLSRVDTTSHERLESFSRSPSLPAPIPPTDHLESVHPLLLQYVAQSQRASHTYGEWPQEHENLPTSGPPAFIEPVVADPRVGSYPMPLQQQRVRGQAQDYGPGYQHYEYTEGSAESHPCIHSAHDTAYLNKAASLPISPISDLPGSQEHHFVDPPPAPFPAPPELHERDQYAAWQAHLAQLGLSF